MHPKIIINFFFKKGIRGENNSLIASHGCYRFRFTLSIFIGLSFSSKTDRQLTKNVTRVAHSWCPIVNWNIYIKKIFFISTLYSLWLYLPFSMWYSNTFSKQWVLYGEKWLSSTSTALYDSFSLSLSRSRVVSIIHTCMAIYRRWLCI